MDTVAQPYGGGALVVPQDRLEYLEQVEVQLYDLKAENNELEKKLRELEEKFRKEREEVKRLQAADFAKGKKDDSRSHDRISQALDEIFSKSVDWAREYFKIDLKDFKIEKIPLFELALSRVLWGPGNSWKRKKLLNVSHLVQAVVAERLATKFFTNPFAGCERHFQKHCCDIYNLMLKENREEANQWRVTTLSAYEKFGKWPPSPPRPSPSRSSQSTTTKSVSFYRREYNDAVFAEIESAISPIAKYLTRQKNEERRQKCKDFINAASDLALELGKHAAEVKVLGKAWFENPECQRGFLFDDERMKDRFGGEDIGPDELPVVDIILRPCLMKYGNDKGENYDKSSVWIPALVDLKRPLKPPGPSP